MEEIVNTAAITAVRAQPVNDRASAEASSDALPSDARRAEGKT
ncbi:hypothetical protein [Arthrobacter sp. NicSoilB8]|nr:hypothetical protein [Arthrobacter sp. NicSoilB8]BCW70950.1 hypothetical protein NicSoilB8_19940 [Arthrobacter sp. NicSoilB8]